MTQALLPGMPPPPAYGDGLDFYRTPRDAVEPLLPHIPRLRTERWNVLEPAAGDGAMLLWWLPHVRRDCSVIGVELQDQRYVEMCANLEKIRALAEPPARWGYWHEDFLKSDYVRTNLEGIEANGNPYLIPFNPPYSEPYEGIGVDFMVRCLELASRVPRSVVAGLLPHDFATGVDRAERVHDRWKGSLYPLKRRPYFGGAHSSGQRPFSWFVFDFLNPQQQYQVIG